MPKTSAQAKNTASTSQTIVDAAIRAFVRFGAGKTSVADIAAEAGLSRQTVYDLFGNKDGIIIAAIRAVTDENLGRVRDQLVESSTLEEKLSIYFKETLIRSFKLIQSSGDTESLISGHSEAGKEEIEKSHQKHEALISAILLPYGNTIARNHSDIKSLAHFFVTAAISFKYSAKTIRELNKLISTLTITVLVLAGEEPERKHKKT